MSDRLDDTRPRPAVNPAAYAPKRELQAPPRFLLWGVIGLFVLGIVGVVSGVLIFRDVLEPAQQSRVMGMFPFMEAFLPPRPAPDDTLPTLASPNNDTAAQDLLNLNLNTSGVQDAPTPVDGDTALLLASTDEVTTTEEAVVTEEIIATTEVAVLPTETPVPPTATPTLEPTIEAVQPTQEPEVASTAETTINTTQDQTVSSVSPEVDYRSSAVLSGISYTKQGWNECGPANITMALSYFGWQNDLSYAANRLKWGREDKNVSPAEMVGFVNDNSQIRALTRIGGDITLIKQLVSNGFPVLLETSYAFEGYDWLGHYRTIIGYDDNGAQFTINDSFIGENILESYNSVDRQWREFNRRFIVLYMPQDEATLARILGDHADPAGAAQAAFDVAQEEAKTDPQDAYAWSNMGLALVQLQDYERASRAFDRALAIGLHWRTLWYQFGMFEAYYNVGRYDDVISLADSVINSSGGYIEEAFYWKGQALAGKGDTSAALNAFSQAISLNGSYQAAVAARDELNSSS
jgi:tetratricopeptide (TPR) repeat protein